MGAAYCKRVKRSNCRAQLNADLQKAQTTGRNPIQTCRMLNLWGAAKCRLAKAPAQCAQVIAPLKMVQTRRRNSLGHAFPLLSR